MIFDFFKRKKEVLDLRKKDGMPVPAKIKEKLLAKESNSSSILTASNTSTETQKQESPNAWNLGGIFDNPNLSSSVSNVPNNLNTDGQTSSIGNQNLNLEKFESQLNDMSYKLSSFSDRLELLERKVERLERKSGII